MVPCSSKSRFALKELGFDRSRGFIILQVALHTDTSQNGKSQKHIDVYDRAGIVAIPFCFALGIANIFHFHLIIIFSILSL